MPSAPEIQDSGAPVDVTRQLARYIARLQYTDLPDDVVAAARRGVLDWLGCALAGSHHPTLDILLSVARELNPQPQATVLGRQCRIGVMEAALVNGQMGHVLDYDDTHMAGVVLHASSPTLAALFALSETSGASGTDFMLAYAVGFEAGVRVGQASPGHHKGGWHLTGTLGTLAASAATARLLGLNEQQTIYALGIGATQAAGMQQNRGTMSKSFHAGKAASNGILAAKLAQKNFNSADDIIEGKRGFCRTFSDIASPELALDGLGGRWEIVRNGHKPYACGVVLHPAIDALIGIRATANLEPGVISEVTLRVHPLVLSITGLADPQTGLKSKFSIYHSAAIALIDGAAGILQYSDARALDPAVIALRRRVKVIADETLRTDEAHAHLISNGQSYQKYVEHALGTAANPMPDAAIQAKFMMNAEPVIGRERAERVCEYTVSLEKQPDVRELLKLCV
jgi:2-methylcitrate dehydratase PrpD